MRKSLERKLERFAALAVKKGLLSPRWASGSLFVTTIREHKKQGLHWYDHAMDFFGEGGLRLREEFARHFGPQVTGSLLRDLKHIDSACPGADLTSMGRDGHYARHVLRMKRRETKQASQDPLSAGGWRNRSLLELDLLKGRLVSVEVEYYGQRMKDTKFHRTGSDGSLTERNDGAEFRLTTWGADSAVRQLTKLAKQGVLFGACCGLHVHVDVRDMDRQTVKAVWHALQTRFGACVKKLVPQSRLENRYCSFSNREPDHRYSAWNYVCFETKGTLEWRMQGPLCRTDWRTDEHWQERVATWMRVCQTITRKLCEDYKQNGKFTLLPSSLTNRPIGWRRFLGFLPEDLQEWCEVRAGRLEAAKIKHQSAKNAIVGAAFGPVPCAVGNRLGYPGDFPYWGRFMTEASAARFAGNRNPCECAECRETRDGIISDARRYGLLHTRVYRDLAPMMHDVARNQVLHAISVESSPDPLTRQVPCLNDVDSSHPVAQWFAYRVAHTVRGAVRELITPNTWQALMNECRCARCTDLRLAGVNRFCGLMEFPRYAREESPVELPPLGSIAYELIQAQIETFRNNRRSVMARVAAETAQSVSQQSVSPQSITLEDVARELPRTARALDNSTASTAALPRSDSMWIVEEIRDAMPPAAVMDRVTIAPANQ